MYRPSSAVPKQIVESCGSRTAATGASSWPTTDRSWGTLSRRSREVDAGDDRAVPVEPPPTTPSLPLALVDRRKAGHDGRIPNVWEPMTRLLIAAVIAAAALSTSGCAGHASVVCGDPAGRSSRGDASSAAAAIVIVHRVADAGLATFRGTSANSYLVSILQVEKGVLEVGDVVLVISTPADCGRARYPGGDPFVALESPLRLLLVPEGEGWRTLWPPASVTPA